MNKTNKHVNKDSQSDDWMFSGERNFRETGEFSLHGSRSYFLSRSGRERFLWTKRGFLSLSASTEECLRAFCALFLFIKALLIFTKALLIFTGATLEMFPVCKIDVVGMESCLLTK